MTTDEEYIRALERENELLREQIARLESVLGMSTDAPLELGLTTQEARVFGVLMAREIARKEAIMAALYRDLGRDGAEPKIVDVFVCRLRKKLKPFCIAVETAWGQGYYFKPETKARIRELFFRREAAA